MKALLLDAPGLDNLTVADAPDPAAGTGQVRIAVEACGLNPVDVWTARSGHPDWSYPHIPGLDIVGRVDAVGVDVSGVAVGDRVALHHDLRTQGGLAELVAVDARAITPVPDALTAVEAAALPCAGLTAVQAVESRLHAGPGSTILVTGGAGGVGGFAVQLASVAGATVLATASSRNHDDVRALGAAHVIDYREEDVAARVRELTDGRGVDGVVDTVSAESATAALGMLAYGGGVACVAGRADLATVPAFTSAPSVHEIALGAAYPSGDPRAISWLSTWLGRLMSLAVAGRLNPRVAETVTLEAVPAALERLASRHVAGKIVATV